MPLIRSIITIVKNLSETPDELLTAVGQRLRRARLDANLSRAQLADRIGVSADTVRNAEGGRNVSLETLIRILRGLGELDRLQGLLADAGPSPVALARQQGRRRQRASGRRRRSRETAWTW